MSLFNCARPGCRDVFHAFLVEKADYEGFIEIPKIDYGDFKPNRLMSFSKAVKSKDFDCWVHFYEDDAVFERIWNNPRKYLPLLEKFNGVICPDFSLYRDMPLVMQYWNIYRSRAIGRWLQDNGINVIANVRWGDYRTHGVCCLGVPHKGTISIGSHGCLRIKEDRECFVKGLNAVLKELNPRVMVIYGAAPDAIFDAYRESGIEILQFDSDYAVSRRKEGV